MNKIVLETDRLILSKFDESYFEGLCKLLSNKKVHKYFPKTLNREESLEFLQKIQKRVKDDGYSFLAVIRKKDNNFIGLCGLLKQIIDNVEEIEVGYRFDDKYWGNGYAPEAAKACLLYARDILKKETVISIILPINTQSIRVAEKNNLKFEKEALFHDLMHNIYRIDLSKL